MVSACLIATVMTWDQHTRDTEEAEDGNESPPEEYDAIDGPSEEEAYLQGEYHLLPYIREHGGISDHGCFMKGSTRSSFSSSGFYRMARSRRE